MIDDTTYVVALTREEMAQLFFAAICGAAEMTEDNADLESALLKLESLFRGK